MVIRNSVRLENLTESALPCGARLASPRRARGERGFTLLELMVVASIIVILAAIAVGRYDARSSRHMKLCCGMI